MIQEVGLENMSRYNQNGESGANNFPFNLRFHPLPAIQSLIPTELQGDDYMAYLHQTSGVPANSVVYDVYATDKPLPMGGSESLIG